ncbi:hypothetical protein TUN199_02416 [Pyrenophora tritici-repentis]|uniref:DUF1421 multi-domain protein n=2 Tax=Pyrenophora tritici-repentis TaxID=45151 RepID=A0A2W1F0S6_9PLEO|nr:uncharacterized protein PTRG_00397 [Pyrenophora tritici-repentis Pt-1C-BFP]KAA8624999.1 hypothetical protein PtrV1_00679 [Pyrenophora tritici-repentis]EDU39835.1 predicted protein [Pyrenophora tritici-repentis Pt-1C-BFP]KAF7453391.1 hypothetical protein A1F99_006490 [Pyrenophora tritici-repentis]KAF7576462.1 DUF1421 multi-domain protein [Pyrenophora tritici-repentis]KAI0625554.1 hypothetical protein TUN199_02416 [Pyrenophora tritici-repentis]
MAPGILWVSSRIVNKDKLDVEKFCEWYENTHIQEVLILPGFPSALRYEAVTPVPRGMQYGKEAPWLTTYAMPDVDYRLSQAFKDLSGGNPPSAELIEAVYKHTRFDTRFYEERGSFPASSTSPATAPSPTSSSSPTPSSSSSSSTPPKFLIAATFHAPKDCTTEFPKQFRAKLLPQLEETPGFVRAKTYEVATALVLDRWNWAAAEGVPGWLVMAEFEGGEAPAVEGFLGEGGVEVGVYKVGRIYSEEEWGCVGE